MNNVAYLLTGGNIGDRAASLAEAEKAIREYCGRVTSLSPVYETAAWGRKDQSAFLNQAICLETRLTADELLAAVLAIEQEMGRVRKEKNGPRLIDIDILFFNAAIIHHPGLTIPHPYIHERRFALQCVYDIAPDFIHPVFHKTITELLAECGDPLEVNKF
jgi:2-amino-4-hydroxy-6-hydroxymethyldihydropteridine diphosphokinase